MNYKVLLILFVSVFVLHASDKFDFYLLPSVGTEFAFLSHSYKAPKYTEIANFFYLKPQMNAKICFYLFKTWTVSYIAKMSFLNQGKDYFTNNLYSKSIIAGCNGIEITARFKKDYPIFFGFFGGYNLIGDKDFNYSSFWAGILAGYDIKGLFILDFSLASSKFRQFSHIEYNAYANSKYNRHTNGPINLNELCIGLNIGYKFYIRNIK